MKWFILSFTTLLCFTAYGTLINPEYQKKETRKKSVECEKAIAVANRKAKEFYDYKRRAEQARRVDDSEGERYRAASKRAEEARDRAMRAGGPSSDIGYLEDAARKWREARRVYQEISAEFYKYLNAESQASAEASRLCHAYYQHERRKKRGQMQK